MTGLDFWSAESVQNPASCKMLVDALLDCHSTMFGGAVDRSVLGKQLSLTDWSNLCSLYPDSILVNICLEQIPWKAQVVDGELQCD